MSDPFVAEKSHDSPVDPVSSSPFGEIPTCGASNGAQCRWCGRSHPRGKFVAGCSGPRLQTGERSRLVRSGALVEDGATALAEKRQAVLADLGDNVGTVLATLVDRFVELDALACYLGQRLALQGPLTTRGRTRATLTAFLAVVDRQRGLAAVLGVARKPRAIDPLEAVKEAVRTRVVR